MREVIVPADLCKVPEPHEISAAEILADYFDAPVIFIKELNRYRQSTPDVLVGDTEWEIKSPKSSKMDKVRRNIDKAIDQAPNVVLDTRRTSIPDKKIIAYITVEVRRHRLLRRLLVIDKRKRVSVISVRAKKNLANRKK